MPTQRKTAIVELVLAGNVTGQSLPLTHERVFEVVLTFDGVGVDAKRFCSPLNDAEWRDFSVSLSKCNVERQTRNFPIANGIRDLGAQLYEALADLSPALAAFLKLTAVPRRLVIQTRRPELHLLPWGAMVDADGQNLAESDCSVVQAWDRFAFDKPLHFSDSINLVEEFGIDTRARTAGSLAVLPPEITRVPLPHGMADILHLEEHGDRVANRIGGADAASLLKYKDAGIALLWSCFSNSGGNSWGDSPALILHRGGGLDAATDDGAALVLSFQSELNYEDAAGISRAFYADVFGPAASRDPESALVRIRATKYEDEFEFCNWASMTVYLRQPLDLSALPLNGPRTPAELWSEDGVLAGDPAWTSIAAAVSGLQPGAIVAVPAGAGEIPAVLPKALFGVWIGNVVRLDGADNPVPDGTLRALNLDPADAPTTGTTDRLLWFFRTIEHFGSPLLIWTGTRPQHLEFLKLSDTVSSLTFLLMYGPEPVLTLAELVDLNRLDEAKKIYDASNRNDLDHVSAYYAFSRSDCKAEQAEACLARIQSAFERALLSGNFVSRFRAIPRTAEQVKAGVFPDTATTAAGEPGSKVGGLLKRQCEEQFYRQAIELVTGETLLRDRGRARHELAYCMNVQNRPHTAEILYRLAVQDLERAPVNVRDTIWNAALAACLRDWADLLARSPDKLDQAGTLLNRALAIHAFHGRALQIAYSLATRAQIALTGCRIKQAIDDAMEACNRFEDCATWNGWVSAFSILLDALAEGRETERMLPLIEMASERIAASNLAAGKRRDMQRGLEFRKAQAHWIAGRLEPAREELNTLIQEIASDETFAASPLAEQIQHLAKFLGVQVTVAPAGQGRSSGRV